MYPDLWSGTRTYPVFILLGIGVGIVVAAASAKRAGIPTRQYVRIQVILILAGVLGAKLYALIEQGKFLTLTWEGTRGYRYPGGIAAGVVALLIAARAMRISLPSVADVFAPSVAFAMAVVRLGCFFNGCCFGIVSDLWWTVRFPAGSPAWAKQIGSGLIPADAFQSLAVHPLQLYFALLSLSVGIFLFWLQPRRPYPGQVALLLLVLLSGGQFLVEFLRAERALHIQLVSLLFAVTGVAGLVFYRTASSTAGGGTGDTHDCKQRSSQPSVGPA
jgi:phosphatidylglycerol:prolipoprotein diacylglycerol transferase